MPPTSTLAPASATPPARRRRLITPKEIAAEKFDGKRSERWVREHVPASARVPHGSRPPLFYEDLVDVWVFGVQVGG
jgi:hypothetical protein